MLRDSRKAAALATDDLADLERLAARDSNGPPELLWTAIEGGSAALQAWCRQRGLVHEVASSVLRLAALPCLNRLIDPLKWLWSEPTWPHGHCPACGSRPLLAEIRGLEQQRWLRCGLCGSGWPVEHAYCPLCESRDGRRLQELTSDERGSRVRVTACEACGGSLVGIATLCPLTAPGLLMAELESLPLQLAAESHAFPGSIRNWEQFVP